MWTRNSKTKHVLDWELARFEIGLWIDTLIDLDCDIGRVSIAKERWNTSGGNWRVGNLII